MEIEVAEELDILQEVEEGRICEKPGGQAAEWQTSLQSSINLTEDVVQAALRVDINPQRQGTRYHQTKLWGTLPKSTLLALPLSP
jgi:hypothetical protein